ncbi:MAG: type II toxin-antitoxin system HicB family antitoxin [Defluviitaleaceae bacterium]|nr:type II toxin-antitoxin system HicB family antitoxin [Defluviitaleaceae bacterium]
MSRLMEYKGYYSNPMYSAEDNIFWGKLEGIADSISFEGTTVDEIYTAFIEAVDDYLDICGKNNMVPKVPFPGRLEIEIEPDMHKQLLIYASNRDVSLNQAVEAALKNLLTA